MIARILLPILLMIVLADVYVDQHFLRRLHTRANLKRCLWWLPSVLIIICTLVLALQPDFAPRDSGLLNTYLFLLGLIVVPKFVFALCSATGYLVRRFITHSPRNYGNLVGAVLVVILWYILIYGSTVGFSKLTVRHVDYYSKDLPAAFDGYRITQFSDAHIGTYSGRRSHILEKAIDTINAQQADAVVFVGDLQNIDPEEITPHINILSRITATDGVFSILGNHDYAMYIKADALTKARNCKATVEKELSMGWRLLRNEHATIRRGGDSIVIGGMENYGVSKRMPRRGDVKKTLSGVTDSAFVVMLQHDPTCWRAKILPESHAQLTLSGHTHAMQFELFGWSPAALAYSEWGGLYTEGERAINVSTGLGGFLPFRFGVPGEVVVITLHRKQ